MDMKLKQEVKSSRTKITNENLIGIVNKEYPEFQAFGLDRIFYAVPLELAKKLIKEGSFVDRRKYLKEEFDCENFSRHFIVDMVDHGYTAVGMTVDTGGRHSYNMIACVEEGSDKIDLYLIEPQNDKFVKIGTSHSKAEMYTGKGFLVF